MKIDIEKVKDFWEKNPLCARDIPYALGSKEYFEYFDNLREAIEPSAFAEDLYEFKNFTGKKVLDVGCGNGWVLSRYAREGADVYGLDLTQTSIDICSKRFSLEGLKANFVVGNAEK